MQSNFHRFANASFYDLLLYNSVSGQVGKWAFFFETGRIWNVVGLMYVGMLLGRIKFFTGSQNAKFIFKVVMLAVGAYILIDFLSEMSANVVSASMGQWVIDQLFVYYKNLFAILIWVALTLFIFSFKNGERLILLWAPAGRLTLTLYIAQSIIFVPLYYGFGLAWYQTIGQVWNLVLGIIFLGLQMILARWWLGHFKYGPLEYVWRRLTLVGYLPAPR